MFLISYHPNPSRSYDPSVSGPSGNITVNGTLTCTNASAIPTLTRRGVGAGAEPGVNLNAPPYMIHNGEYARFDVRECMQSYWTLIHVISHRRPFYQYIGDQLNPCGRNRGSRRAQHVGHDGRKSDTSRIARASTWKATGYNCALNIPVVG